MPNIKQSEQIPPRNQPPEVFSSQIHPQYESERSNVDVIDQIVSIARIQRDEDLRRQISRLLREIELITESYLVSTAGGAVSPDYSLTSPNNHRFFSAEPIAPGINTQALESLAGINIDNIPEAFCCALSNEIMDDPVFDPNHPQYKFERKNINKALGKSKQNPFTRTPLNTDELISDVNLKNQIEAYVNSCISTTDRGNRMR